MKSRLLVFVVVIIVSAGGFPLLAAPGQGGFSSGAAELEIETDLFPESGAGKLENGKFILIDRFPTSFPGPEDDVVKVLDGQGQLVFQRAPGLDIPGASLVNVRDATVSSAGRLVVAAFVRNDSNQNAAVLIEYDLDNAELVRIERTFPIQCESLRSDNLGTVWCAGFESEKAHNGEQDFDLVYRFDGAGRLLGSCLSLSDFSTETHPMIGRGPERFGFLPGNGGHVWLLVPGAREIVGFGKDGSVIEGLKLPPWPIPPQFDPEQTFVRYVVAPDDTITAAVWTAKGSGDQRFLKQFIFRLA